jgi:hypothetical protein
VTSSPFSVDLPYSIAPTTPAARFGFQVSVRPRVYRHPRSSRPRANDEEDRHDSDPPLRDDQMRRCSSNACAGVWFQVRVRAPAGDRAILSPLRLPKNPSPLTPLPGSTRVGGSDLGFDAPVGSTWDDPAAVQSPPPGSKYTRHELE